MADDPPGGMRRARDLALLDAIDAFPREAFEGQVWRVVREERDPTLGGPSRSRWCDGSFDVLYTSLARDGAIAEIDALLSLQPVFPSKIRWLVHTLRVFTARTLRLADPSALARLGVVTERWADRDYLRSQAIAEAAFFLGFDGLIAPSARWPCDTLVLFDEQMAPGAVTVVASEPVDLVAWRRDPDR